MEFKYLGPHDAVDLPGIGTVALGKTIEVTGPAAESLSEQTETWERVDTKTKAKSADKKTED